VLAAAGAASHAPKAAPLVTACQLKTAAMQAACCCCCCCL
jgi:hypothetical protein